MTRAIRITLSACCASGKRCGEEGQGKGGRDRQPCTPHGRLSHRLGDQGGTAVSRRGSGPTLPGSRPGRQTACARPPLSAGDLRREYGGRGERPHRHHVLEPCLAERPRDVQERAHAAPGGLGSRGPPAAARTFRSTTARRPWGPRPRRETVGRSTPGPPPGSDAKACGRARRVAARQPGGGSAGAHRGRGIPSASAAPSCDTCPRGQARASRSRERRPADRGHDPPAGRSSRTAAAAWPNRGTPDGVPLSRAAARGDRGPPRGSGATG
jgi:hypothetical protein